ncbi:MAG TPA: hypothetical protein VGJ15_11105, partial [Pirellulales bacterium]
MLEPTAGAEGAVDVGTLDIAGVGGFGCCDGTIKLIALKEIVINSGAPISANKKDRLSRCERRQACRAAESCVADATAPAAIVP